MLRNYLIGVLIICSLASCATNNSPEVLKEVDNSRKKEPLPLIDMPTKEAPKAAFGYSGESPRPAPILVVNPLKGTDGKLPGRYVNHQRKKVIEHTVLANPRTNDKSVNFNDPNKLTDNIDNYLQNLRSAAFTFNVPSPIKVAKSVTVYFWLDSAATPEQLEAALKKLVPHDTVESGNAKWGPLMRATLSGADFDLKPLDSEEQPVSQVQRTTWSWEITPKHPGIKLPLHLRLEILFPKELGLPRKTLTSLDKTIDVEVTWWWLFDYYFDKYWKWLLGSLGTAISGIVVWWWNNKRTTPKNNAN